MFDGDEYDGKGKSSKDALTPSWSRQKGI